MITFLFYFRMDKYGESRGVILTRYRKFLDRKRIRKKLKGSEVISL